MNERIQSLDVLRGVALLGILVMNIQSFSMVETAYFNPMAYGRMDGIHGAIWYVSHLLFDTKFMAMFSMMFGASMLLIVERVKARGDRPFPVHARRNLALLAIGWVHAHLLWFGDILFPYAVCAFFIYWFRNRSPRTLFIVGTLILVIGSSLMLMAGLTADQWPEEQLAETYSDWQPTPEAIEEELAIYRGGWLTQQPHRHEVASEMQTMVLWFYFFWRCAGVMLLGMGLFKLGVLSAERSKRFYWSLIAFGVVVGLPLVHYAGVSAEASGWDAIDAFFLSSQYNYWGSLPVALGWIGAVMLLCKSAERLRRMSALAAVGRMAFTNYLMQTVICTFIFYGHGLGLFGQVERLGQIGIVVAVWVVQLLYSPWWLKRFRYGPAEWLWRSATYLKWQGFRV